MKKYIVKDGDTMWTISKATGIRHNLLVAANPQVRDPNQLQPGSLIMIPELTKKSVGEPKPETATQPKTSAAQHHDSAQGKQEVPPYFGFVWPHVVQQGETWADIAKKYGVSSAQLQHLNPKESPQTLEPGAVIYIPALGPMPGGTAPAPSHGGAPGIEFPGHEGGGYGQTPGMPPGYGQPHGAPGGPQPTPGHQVPDASPWPSTPPAGVPMPSHHYLPQSGPSAMGPAPSPDTTGTMPGQWPPGGWEQHGPHTHVPRYDGYWRGSYPEFPSFGGYPPQGYNPFTATYGHYGYDDSSFLYPTDTRMDGGTDWENESSQVGTGSWNYDVEIEHYDLSPGVPPRPDTTDD